MRENPQGQHFKGLDPFHLNIRACAMDWRTLFAGSKGERVSWVDGRAYSCIRGPIYMHLYILACQLRAMRMKYAFFANYGLSEWATSGVSVWNGGLTESTASVR